MAKNPSVIEAMAKRCESQGYAIGLTAIPWQQLITALLSMLTGCFPASKAQQISVLQAGNRREWVAARRVARQYASDADDDEAIAGVVVRAGMATTTADAEAALAEAAG